VRESIRGYADAVVEETAPTGVIGRLLHPGPTPVAAISDLATEVAGVRDLLAASDELRQVLTDPGVPAHARRAVLSDLFGDRISANALRLLLFTVERGRAAELAEDVTALAERTQAADQGLHPVGPAVLGHRAALERIDGYADAVLASVADDRGLAEVEDELFRFERIVAGSTQLSEALTGRDVPSEARAGLVADLLGSKTSTATTRLAAYASTIGRPRDYLELLAALVTRVANETNRRIAEVRAVVDLTDEQQERLATALSRIVGQRVEVRVVLDPSVLGGFVATIGDTVVDGSVRHRLDLLKERLVVSETSSTDQGVQS
jgi:F-type H+-transporting ATPase subunit delta